MKCSYLSSGYAVYCMLYCACFFCVAFLAIPLVIILGTKGSKNYPLKMNSDRDRQTRGAAFELTMGLSRFSIQKGYCCTFTVVSRFSCVRWTIGE